MRKFFYVFIFVIFSSGSVYAACVGGTWQGYAQDPGRCAAPSCVDSLGIFRTCTPGGSNNGSCCSCTAPRCNTASTLAEERCADYTTPSTCSGANFSGWACNNGVTCSWDGPLPQPTRPQSTNTPPVSTSTTAPGGNSPTPLPTSPPPSGRCDSPKWCTTWDYCVNTSKGSASGGTGSTVGCSSSTDVCCTPPNTNVPPDPEPRCMVNGQVLQSSSISQRLCGNKCPGATGTCEGSPYWTGGAKQQPDGSWGPGTSCRIGFWSIPQQEACIWNGANDCCSGPALPLCGGINISMSNPTPAVNELVNVNIDRTGAWNPAGFNNVVLMLDGVRVPGLALCFSNGSLCDRGYHVNNMNVGGVGVHTLQFGALNGDVMCENKLTYEVSGSCTANWVNASALVPPIVRGGPPVTFDLQVTPNNVTITSVSPRLTPAAGLTLTLLTPFTPTSSPFTLRYSLSAGFNAVPQALINFRFNTAGRPALCSMPTTLQISTQNPSTTFFTAGGGGDVIAAGGGSAGEVRSSISNPDPTTPTGTYFAHNPKPAINDVVNLGIVFARTLSAPLNSSNINARGWFGNTGSTGFSALVTKRENTYIGIRDRIEAQLTVPMLTANNMNRVDQIAGFPCGPDTCVSGVHIIKYTGGTIGTNASSPVNINRNVLLFSDNGGVVTIQSPIRVAPGVFFGLFTQGSITIAHEVGEVNGNTDITLPTYPPHLSGIYYAQGDINFGSGAGVFGCVFVPTPPPPAVYNPNVPQCGRQIRINGSVIAMGRVNLNRRHLGDKPAEYVHFVPDYAYQLYLVGTRQKKYQELLAP